MVEGTALNSRTLICKAGMIVKSVKEMELLACEPHVISFIKRVKRDWIWAASEHRSNVQTRQTGTVVVVSGTMPVTLVPYSQSKIMVTEAHAEFLNKTPACVCDPTAKQGGKDLDGFAEYGQLDNNVMFQCSWCKVGEDQLEALGT